MARRTSRSGRDMKSRVRSLWPDTRRRLNTPPPGCQGLSAAPAQACDLSPVPTRSNGTGGHRIPARYLAIGRPIGFRLQENGTNDAPDSGGGRSDEQLAAPARSHRHGPDLGARMGSVRGADRGGQHPPARTPLGRLLQRLRCPAAGARHPRVLRGSALLRGPGHRGTPPPIRRTVPAPLRRVGGGGWCVAQPAPGGDDRGRSRHTGREHLGVHRYHRGSADPSLCALRHRVPRPGPEVASSRRSAVAMPKSQGWG